jgi:hypothetical protein
MSYLYFQLKGDGCAHDGTSFKLSCTPVLRIRIRIRRILTFLGLLDPHPDPLIRGLDPDPVPYCQAKIVRKTLIPTVLLLVLDFLSLKNDVNVPSKSNKQKNCIKKICYLLAS